MSRKSAEYEVSVQSLYIVRSFTVRAYSHRQAYLRFMKQHSKKVHNFRFVVVTNLATKTVRQFVAKTGAILFVRDASGVCTVKEGK